jgi:hypothetical protein
MELSVVTAAVSARRTVGRATSVLQVRRSAPDQYLIEMVDQNTWVQEIKQMIADRRSVMPLAHLQWRGSGVDLNTDSPPPSSSGRQAMAGSGEFTVAGDCTRIRAPAVLGTGLADASGH